MARTKLTAASVDRIKPPSNGRAEHFDAMLPGFGLRVTDKGAKSWIVFYRVQDGPEKGKQRRLTLGTYPILSLADARKAARLALQNVAAGGDPARDKQDRKAAEPAKAVTFDGVVSEFIERYAKKRNRSWKETERILTVYFADWHGKPIDSITKGHVIDILDRVEERGGYMANRVFAAARKLFNWAVERDRLPASPMAGLKPPAKETSRDRVLTDDELVVLWEATGEIGYPFGPMVRLLLLTGQRREEVAVMSKPEIAEDTWTIPAERSKNGEANRVPLNSLARKVLEGLPKFSGDYLLTTGRRADKPGEKPISGFSVAKSRLDKKMVEIMRRRAEKLGTDPEKATLKGWRIHDIRRTVASGMARLGIAPHVVERILNHTGGTVSGVAAVYNRYSYDTEKAAALEAWGSYVAALIGRGADNVVPIRTTN